MSDKEKTEKSETETNNLANENTNGVKSEEVGAIKKEEVNLNGLADIHSGNAEKNGVQEKEAPVNNGLADIHAENPKDKDGKVVTNHFNQDPDDATNKGADDGHPTKLGNIELEKEEE